jgi:hypothetical protein
LLKSVQVLGRLLTLAGPGEGFDEIGQAVQRCGGPDGFGSARSVGGEQKEQALRLLVVPLGSLEEGVL